MDVVELLRRPHWRDLDPQQLLQLRGFLDRSYRRLTDDIERLEQERNDVLFQRNQVEAEITRRLWNALNNNILNLEDDENRGEEQGREDGGDGPNFLNNEHFDTNELENLIGERISDEFRTHTLERVFLIFERPRIISYGPEIEGTFRIISRLTWRTRERTLTFDAYAFSVLNFLREVWQETLDIVLDYFEAHSLRQLVYYAVHTEQISHFQKMTGWARSNHRIDWGDYLNEIIDYLESNAPITLIKNSDYSIWIALNLETVRQINPTRHTISNEMDIRYYMRPDPDVSASSESDAPREGGGGGGILDHFRPRSPIVDLDSDDSMIVNAQDIMLASSSSSAPSSVEGYGCSEFIKASKDLFYFNTMLFPKKYQKQCFLISIFLILFNVITDEFCWQVQEDARVLLNFIDLEILDAWISHLDLRNGMRTMEECERVGRYLFKKTHKTLVVFDEQRKVFEFKSLHTRAGLNAINFFIGLFVKEKHYFPIINLDSFVGFQTHHCSVCKKNRRWDHVCLNRCGLCSAKLTCGNRAAHSAIYNPNSIVCEACDQYFSSFKCFNHHLKKELKTAKSFCDIFKVCQICMKRCFRDKKHVCGRYCVRCGCIVGEKLNFPIFKAIDRVHDDEDHADIYHQCPFKLQIGKYADFITVFDYETFNKKNFRTGVFDTNISMTMAHQVAWRTACKACFYGENVNCEHHNQRCMSVMGTDCTKRWMDQMFKEIDDKIKKCTVVLLAHNGGNFDFQILVNDLTEEKENLKITYIKRGTTILSCKFSLRRGGKTIDFVCKDTFLLFSSSLRDLAKTCQVENKGYFPMALIPGRLNEVFEVGEMPDVEDFHSGPGESDFATWYEEKRAQRYVIHREYVAYCKQDVNVLFQICKKMSSIVNQYITKKLDVFFDVSIITASKLSAMIWFTEFYTEETLCYDFPTHMVIKNTFHSWKLVDVVYTLKSLDKFSRFNSKYQVIKLTNERWLCVLDCAHYGCRTCYFEKHWTYNNQIMLADITLMCEIYKAWLKKKFGRIDFVYDCGMKEYLNGHSIKDYSIERHLNPKEYFENGGSEPLFNHLAGGRVENFTTGWTVAAPTEEEEEEEEEEGEEGGGAKEKGKYFDIVSLYPYVNQLRYGHGKMSYLRQRERSRLKEQLNDGLLDIDEDETILETGISFARVLAPTNLLVGILHYKVRGTLTFPLCRTCALTERGGGCTHDENERELYGWYTHTDLVEACKCGYVVRHLYASLRWRTVSRLVCEFFRRLKRLKLLSSKIPSAEDRTEFIRLLNELEGLDLESEEFKHDETLRAIIKIIMNAWWGRCATNAFRMTRFKIVGAVELNQMLKRSARFHVLRQGPCKSKFFVKYRERNFKFTGYLPNIAFFTTSKARRRITGYARAINRDIDCTCEDKVRVATTAATVEEEEVVEVEECKRHRVHYMDTDSIFFLAPKEFNVPESVPVSSAFGDFKNELGENQNITSMTILGPKAYAFQYNKNDDANFEDKQTKIKAKGVIKKKIKDLTMEIFQDIVKTSNPYVVNQCLLFRRHPNHKLYVKVDDTGRLIESPKSIGITLNKRFVVKREKRDGEEGEEREEGEGEDDDDCDNNSSKDISNLLTFPYGFNE